MWMTNSASLIRQLARSWLWRSELPTGLLLVTVWRLVCLRGGLADAGPVSSHTAADLVLPLWYMSLQHGG